MIDLSQWRARIGQWNYRGPKSHGGHHCPLFKGNGKPYGSTSEGKAAKLLKTFSVVAFILTFILRQMQLTLIGIIADCKISRDFFTATNWMQSVDLGAASIIVNFSITLLHYLVFFFALLLLLLSGDVELNPGPIIDKRPVIRLLIEWLDELVDWQTFGLLLPGITYSMIEKIRADNQRIDHQKIALYAKWLEVFPDATWRDVIAALEAKKETKLAKKIRDDTEGQGSSTMMNTSIQRGQNMQQINISSQEDEKFIYNSLTELDRNFASLMTKVLESFKKCIRLDIIKQWLINSSHLKCCKACIDDVLNATNINEIFLAIDSYYDCIDCDLIVDLCLEFIDDKIVDELKEHNINANNFRSSTTVRQLHNDLKSLYFPCLNNLSNMPTIYLQLQNPWNDTKIEILRNLIGKLLPLEFRQSLLKCITIASGSVIVHYTALDCTLESLKVHIQEKVEFLCLLGVFHLSVDGHVTLTREENSNFSFEAALNEAKALKNFEAMEFLVQILQANNTQLYSQQRRKAKTSRQITIHDQPSSLLFVKWLKPLDDWKSYALFLPGIIQSDINVIDKTKQSVHRKKLALHELWLERNSQASWKDVIISLKKCKKNELANIIRKRLQLSISEPLQATASVALKHHICDQGSKRHMQIAIERQPSLLLLTKWLKPLVDWRKFALFLPGITHHDINTIDKMKQSAHQKKTALFEKWLYVYPEASWRHVITSLEECQENDLEKSVIQNLGASTSDLLKKSTNLLTSRNPVSSKAVYTEVSLKPREILCSHSECLTNIIATNLCPVSNALYGKELIPLQTKEEMLVIGITNYSKAMKLLTVLQRHLESSSDPESYLIDVCHVFISQQYQTLTDIASTILQQLGQPLRDKVTVTHIIPDDVQQYADIMRHKYKEQPIVGSDSWPPRVGNDFFGRLVLVEKQKLMSKQDYQKSAWYMLRGQVDEIPKLSGNKEITIEDFLQPKGSLQSLRVLIDGPPGIGKTTLCRKLLNIWSNRTLAALQKYDLVLYCPLRNNKIATATTLASLFVYQSPKVLKVVDWISDREGEGLLIIFDGWDELTLQLRQSSITSSIICRECLLKCSVIITSRSYASSSLLEMHSVSKHVQVIGFSKQEISKVIIQTLQSNRKLAQELIDEKMVHDESITTSQSHYFHRPASSLFKTSQVSKESVLAVKLINNLEVRSDVQSLCYIPLVCSMVILVYCKEEHLPTTLTQLYENFILQTIRRHVKKAHYNIEPRNFDSLDTLPSELGPSFGEMCQFAYTNLAVQQMTFTSCQLQQSLNQALKEDYLGFLTAFIEYDDTKYQFLHLSIQEFLAAWWIAKHNKNTEELFKYHFANDHFRMCLRFVAGMTQLGHESYQQYFNRQHIDVLCKRNPVFKYQNLYHSFFYQHPERRVTLQDQMLYPFVISRHTDFQNELPIFLLQLLYESQNTKLCQVLAHSIKDHSLCLHNVTLSLFDILCLRYLIINSNLTWNYLDLNSLTELQLFVFLGDLLPIDSQQARCTSLTVGVGNPTVQSIQRLLHLPLLCSIQEFYCVLYDDEHVSSVILQDFLKFSQLKVLHLTICPPLNCFIDTDKADANSVFIELEKHLEQNASIKELKFECLNRSNRLKGLEVIISIIRGITRNRSITSLILGIDLPSCSLILPEGTMEQLLKYNTTLQALYLNLYTNSLSPSLNFVDINAPLTALEIGVASENMAILLLPHLKNLKSLKLIQPHPSPSLLFLSHPVLQQLTLPLYTNESAIELFTILKTNKTLQALRVDVFEGYQEEVYTIDVSHCLGDMLTHNQTIRCLEISCAYITNSFLSFLATGLRYNNSLHQLKLPIPLPNNEEVRTIIDVISQKLTITEIKINFVPDEMHYTSLLEKDEGLVTKLFYTDGLVIATRLLQSHALRLLRINGYLWDPEEYDINDPTLQTEPVQNFYKAIYLHPSLECIEIPTPFFTLTKIIEETLIAKYKQQIPSRQSTPVIYEYKFSIDDY